MNLNTRLLGTDDATILEVVDFYERALVPEMVCGNGNSTGKPSDGWLRAPGRTIVAAFSDDVLAGVWVVRRNEILYPCVDVTIDGEAGLIAIFKALWKESTQHFSELTASTDNAAIMAWARRAKAPASVTVFRPTGLNWRPK